ncbi:MAG TPA: NUDIX domain-containing protein [Anaerolineaceae bacterium]|nr:NUDIX domain-containing protein [Anaerolineaceae bacterium]
MDNVTTETQVSAGGVAYRPVEDRFEVILISVGIEPRWQLPKGMVERDEPVEAAARREVREEAGVETELVAPLDTIEYWYFANRRGERVRFHKFVHFYLMRYRSGQVTDHDHEVHEARWFDIDEAIHQLAFENERQLVAKAREVLTAP